MKKLDVSGLRFLQNLNCSNNQLPEFDVSGLSDLGTCDVAAQKVGMIEAEQAGEYYEIDLAKAFPGIDVSRVMSVKSDNEEEYTYDNTTGKIKISPSIGQEGALTYLYDVKHSTDPEAMMDVHLTWFAKQMITTTTTTMPLPTVSTSPSTVPTTTTTMPLPTVSTTSSTAPTASGDEEEIVLGGIQDTAGIKIAAKRSVLPENVVLVVEPQEKVYEGLSTSKAYDIYFLKDNVHYEINGDVRVEIPYGPPLTKEGLVVFYDDGTRLIPIDNVQVDDEKASFITNHFSVYVLANKKAVNVPVSPTGEQINMYLIIGTGLFIASLLTCALMMWKKQRRTGV